MIRACFSTHNGIFTKVSVTGHADFAEYGEDIVCAAVTSAVALTANGITEILGIPATVLVLENEISIAVPNGLPEKNILEASHFLSALHLQLSALQQDYSENIIITSAEV